MSVKGIGDCFIIGIHPNMPLTFGTRTIGAKVGIIDKGDFEMLVGNDVTTDIGLQIDIASRTCTYKHP